MNMIEQIKADREAGTAGSWIEWHGQIGTENTCVVDANSINTGQPDINRIARVTDMEAALIAAFDALVSNIEMDDDGLTGFVPIEEINKFRTAIGAT